MAEDKGHYGSIIYRSASDDGPTATAFNVARQRRIAPAVGESGQAEFGIQTINVVAGAALFTDPDVTRFVNSLAIHAMLEAADQMKISDGSESFLSAFEIHTQKKKQPTMLIYIFFRENDQGRIKQLHLNLQKGRIPGMEKFKELGISMGKPGLAAPYLRTGPGGKPFLHGNKGDGPRGFDPNSDWMGYRVQLTLPDSPQFSDYADGNPALTSHLDDAANIPLGPLADLVIGVSDPKMEATKKSRLHGLIKSSSGSYQQFQKINAGPNDSVEHKIARDVRDLLNINMVHDVQKTASAEFWRNFK